MKNFTLDSLKDILVTKEAAYVVGGIAVLSAVGYGIYRFCASAKQHSNSTDASATKAEPSVAKEADKTTASKQEKSTAVMERFNDVWDSVNVIKQFNPEWENKTGYFDHAVKEAIPVGTVAVSKEPGAVGRKIFLVGTEHGTLVVFQRYTNGDKGVVVKNATPEWSAATGVSGSLTLKEFEEHVGKLVNPAVK